MQRHWRNSKRFLDIETISHEISYRRNRLIAKIEAEAEKLDGWADDLKLGLEREIKEFDRQIREVRKTSMAALTLEEKLAGQKQIKALESERGKRRRALFDAQEQIDQRRDKLIEEIEGKLQQNSKLRKPLCHSMAGTIKKDT